MLTIQEINKAIMSQQWTNDELHSIIDAVKWNRSQLARTVKRSVTIGSTVKFTSNKNGNTYQGFVTKIAIKYITVKTHAGLQWRVPANMLEVV